MNKGYVLVGLFAPVLALWLTARREPPAKVEEPPVGVTLPSPIAATLPRPEIEMLRARSRAEELQEAKAGWAVVAATHREYEAAERHARALSSDSSFRAIVFPSKGDGSKYMVVLASGLEQSDAHDIREEAVQSGMPGDTYVTKLLPGN